MSIRTGSVLSMKSACYHCARQTLVEERIFELTPIHASLILRFAEFIESYVGKFHLCENWSLTSSHPVVQCRSRHPTDLTILFISFANLPSHYLHCFPTPRLFINDHIIRILRCPGNSLLNQNQIIIKISGSESFTRWLAPGSELGVNWERAGSWELEVMGARLSSQLTPACSLAP